MRQDAGREGHPRFSLVVCGVLAVTLSGCAVGAGTAGQASPTPRADLAAEAEAAAANLKQQPAGERHRDRPRHEQTARRQHAGDSGARTDRTEQAADRNGAASTEEDSGATGGSRASWQPVLLAADGRGDHGSGPGYADLVSLTIEDDGSSLRLSVEVGGVLPARLAGGEVQGVGIDLFRSRSDESDFQVFLDGGADGWHGYLQTPRGFVRYPGDVRIDGRMLVTELPWSSLGGRSEAQVSAFADWSDAAGDASSDSVDRSALRLG
jgi:hypothetical protein